LVGSLFVAVESTGSLHPFHRLMRLSVGAYVALDGDRSGEIACVNADGTFDLIMDNGTDADAVPASRLQLSSTQRERTSSDSSKFVGEGSLEAAAAALRLGLT